MVSWYNEHRESLPVAAVTLVGYILTESNIKQCKKFAIPNLFPYLCNIKQLANNRR